MGEHRCNTDTAAALLYSSIVIVCAGCTFLCKEAKGKIAAMKHSLRDHPGYINTCNLDPTVFLKLALKKK